MERFRVEFTRRDKRGKYKRGNEQQYISKRGGMKEVEWEDL